MACSYEDLDLLEDDPKFINFAQRDRKIESRFDQLKEFVQSTEFVSTVEKIKELYYRICLKNGWVPQTMQRLNGGQDGERVDEEVLDKIRKWNYFDAQLYNLVDNPAFESDPAREKNVPINSALNFDESLRDVDITSGYFCEGWYPPETNESGESRRWTGPSNISKLCIPKYSQNVSVVMKFRAHEDCVVENLRIKVENAEAKLHKFKNRAVDHVEWIVQFCCGKCNGWKRYFDVVIEVDEVICPRTKYQINDDRKLGVYLYYLGVKVI